MHNTCFQTFHWSDKQIAPPQIHTTGWAKVGSSHQFSVSYAINQQIASIQLSQHIKLEYVFLTLHFDNSLHNIEKITHFSFK